MKKLVIFLVIIYITSATYGWYMFSKSTAKNLALSQELAVARNELVTFQDGLAEAQAVIEGKINEARINASFLALALCPTLEATDKNASCVINSTEWLSQTIISGTALTSPEAKAKMDALLVALSKKTKPTARQLYEMLRPIEVDALKALTESLK